jgi:hypothetical protein
MFPGNGYRVREMGKKTVDFARFLWRSEIAKLR